MGAKNCLNHPKVPAATTCTQCHKPICPSCTMVTPMGRFCSSECSIVNRETKTKMQPTGGSKSGGQGAKAAVLLLLVLILGLVSIHMFKGRNPTLNKIDVLGRVMGDKGVKPMTDSERQRQQQPQ